MPMKENIPRHLGRPTVWPTHPMDVPHEVSLISTKSEFLDTISLSHMIDLCWGPLMEDLHRKEPEISRRIIQIPNHSKDRAITWSASQVRGVHDGNKLKQKNNYI